jgi:FtsZ-binding cell division protein ZapB
MKTCTKSEIIFLDLNNYVQQKINTIKNRKINYKEIKKKNKKLEKLQQMKNKRTKT